MGLVLTLILVGIILLIAELLLIPGVGVAGVFGIVSLCGASYYSFAFLGGLQGAIVTVVDIALISVAVYFALRAKTWKKLELKTVIDNTKEDNEVCAGDRGRTITRLAPMGKARFNGFSCEVTAVEGMIDPGVEVEVVHIENNKIYVKTVMPDEAF
ncbi:MAG: NfeD family protein [Candidatus Cryptobacteroides sp.]